MFLSSLSKVGTVPQRGEVAWVRRAAGYIADARFLFVPVIQTLTGPTLLSVLRSTSEDVKLFEKEASGYVRITPQQALSLARSGLYEGTGTYKRVKSMREIDSRAPNIADASFWDGRGCIRFFADQRSGAHAA